MSTESSTALSSLIITEDIFLTEFNNRYNYLFTFY